MVNTRKILEGKKLKKRRANEILKYVYSRILTCLLTLFLRMVAVAEIL